MPSVLTRWWFHLHKDTMRMILLFILYGFKKACFLVCLLSEERAKHEARWLGRWKVSGRSQGKARNI